MSELFVERVELVRDDGVRLLAVRLTPDFDAAEGCHGAGLVVVADEELATDAVFARVVRPLADAGYFVVALPLSGDLDDTIVDLQAALLAVKELARGKLGVIGLGGAATVALAAAAVLPQLDAVVHAGGAVPPASARLGRARAAVLVHQATGGALLRDEDVAALTARLAPSKAPLLIRRHDAADGFFLDDTLEGRLAREQTRQFLDHQLT